MGQGSIPELLLPLREACRVVDGGEEATRVGIAIREALAVPGNCEVQRVRPGRAVALLTTVEGNFVVRAFEAGFMARLSPLRFCPSGREWRALWACRDKGVATCRPVALLAARGALDVNYNVVERVSNGVTFSDYLARERRRLLAQPEGARRLIAALASYIASLHNNGIVIPDLHPWHLLLRVSKGKTDVFEFFLPDVGEILPASQPSAAQLRLANLAEFALGFEDWPNSLKYRFLRAYRGEMGDSNNERDAVREISGVLAQRRFDFNTARVSSCADPSSAQARVDRGGYALLLNRTIPNVALSELEEPLANAEPAQWEALLMRHFGSRLGEANLYRIERGFKPNSASDARRAIEGIWGRLLEMDALAVHSPMPLACMIAPHALLAICKVPGRFEPLTRHKDAADWSLIDDLARDLLKLHAAGCFVLPGEPQAFMDGLQCAVARGERSLVLAAPDHLFRGTPNTLGMQAIASLGRAARAISLGMGERAMKELVWSYARLLRLSRADTEMLFEEAARVPTGRTLVVTRGIERAASGARK